MFIILFLDKKWDSLYFHKKYEGTETEPCQDFMGYPYTSMNVIPFRSRVCDFVFLHDDMLKKGLNWRA